MISGKTFRTITLRALLTLLPATAWCAASDLDAVLAHMARPAPATTPFVEAHFSHLLARPLVVTGMLEYLGPGQLARTVEQPYHERSEIHGDEVTVTRPGDKPRHFSLSRAPEMRSFLASFGGLLAGDRSALEQQFELALKGDQQNWTLVLTPHDGHVRQHILSITVSGTAAGPRCLTTNAPNDAATVMLVAEAAQSPPPQGADRATFEALCRGAAP
jgi:hypothetical protein